MGLRFGFLTTLTYQPFAYIILCGSFVEREDHEVLALLLVSLALQGPIPVVQAKIGARRLLQSLLASILVSVAAAVIFTAVIMLPKGPEFTAVDGLNAKVLGFIAGAVLMYAIANPLMLMCIPVIGGTYFAILFTLRIVPLAFVSAWLLGEAITWLLVLGAATIIAGVIDAKLIELRLQRKQADEDAPSETPLVEEEKSIARRRLAWIGAVAATLTFGAGGGLDAVVVEEISTTNYVPIRLIVPALLMSIGAIAVSLVKKKQQATSRFKFTPLLLAAILIPMSASTLLWAIESSGRPTLVMSLHQLSLFFTIATDAWVKKGPRSVPREMVRYARPAAVCSIGVALSLVG